MTEMEMADGRGRLAHDTESICGGHDRQLCSAGASACCPLRISALLLGLGQLTFFRAPALHSWQPWPPQMLSISCASLPIICHSHVDHAQAAAQASAQNDPR